ncbi:MAG: hypothetical protein ACRDFW_05995 [bacterium]
MALELVTATAAQKDDPLYQLARLETTIRASDERALRARWNSGKKLRVLRESGYDKTLEEIAEHLGVSQSELSFRMHFAESEEALITASNKGWSWYDVHQHMTELVGRKRAPRKPRANSPVIKEVRLFVRQMKKALQKVHAHDLTDADFKVLDAIQEEIARIYDEVDR